MVISLASRKVFLQLFAHMYLRVLFTGSHVFCCFIDFKKAFDNVDYWLLFRKLIDSNCFQSCLARVLSHWYSNQQVAVHWQNSYTHSALVYLVDVRQGGILSPYLFKYCMSETC